MAKKYLRDLPSSAEEREHLRIGLGLSDINNTFESFKPIAGARQSLALFKEISSNPAWRMLACYGSPGNGKTHLCEALAIDLWRQGIFTRVVAWAQVIRRFKGSFDKQLGELPYHMVFDRFLKMERLILDDVGTGTSGSAWEWAELEEIVRYRYHENKFTVITSNLDSLPARVVSRFNDNTRARIIKNEAPDYRPKKGGGI